VEHGELRSVGESGMAATPQMSESRSDVIFLHLFKVVGFNKKDSQLNGPGRLMLSIVLIFC
jgi:hypothetical protein